MKFKNNYLIGIALGAMVFFIDVAIFMKTNFFVPLIVLAVTLSWIMPLIDFFAENQRQKEIETRFLDFVRNLTGAIKSGMPVSRAIIHISKIDYGALSPYVVKLGHQVEWAIPVHKSLLFFSNNTRNDVIRRSIATVIEAEQSGGNMEDVLESITSSLIEIKKIKEQRRASIHAQIVQSYIIFFIFIGVMVVVQKMLVPYLVGTGQGGMFSSLSGGTLGATPSNNGPSVVMSAEIRFDSITNFVISLTTWMTSINGIFLMLSVIQGFFAGVIIGKMAEGDITSGLKHSVVLMTIAIFVMTMF